MTESGSLEITPAGPEDDPAAEGRRYHARLEWQGQSLSLIDLGGRLAALRTIDRTHRICPPRKHSIHDWQAGHQRFSAEATSQGVACRDQAHQPDC